MNEWLNYIRGSRQLDVDCRLNTSAITFYIHDARCMMHVVIELGFGRTMSYEYA